MIDQTTKRAAQEYLAAKLSEDEERSEHQLNLQAAIQRAPAVWKRVADTVIAQCREWNAITSEQTLTCKETAMGDLRIWCAGRNHQLTIHYNPYRRQVILRNTARPENEEDTVLLIEGYRTDSGRDAHLTRNNQEINLDMLVTNHLRMLTGLSREANG
jgi:hypothetical protein